MTSINHAEVAETLHRAADLIEQRGWQHGPPVDGSAWDWGGEGSASLCLEGAIFAALDRPRYWASNEINACPAGRAVRDHLADRFVGDNLWTWNDDPQRTASEVIEVLRATAAVEQAKHDTELPPIQRFEDGSWSVILPVGWRAATVESADVESFVSTSW